VAGRAPQGGGRVDLHTHTVFSDGLLTPEALVGLATESGLSAIAITDHDSVDGIAAARAAAGPTLEVVPGIEISTSLGGSDLHVLGYYVDPTHAGLAARLRKFGEERLERVHAIVERLASLGASVSLDAVMESAGPGVVGRPHVAAALVRAGLAEDQDDAFRRFLGPRARAYVPRPALHPREAVALIDAAGGVSALAHGGSHVSDATIEELAGAGLDGVEVWHPQHGPTLIKRYRALATRLGLLETGGSDFHGPGRGAALGEMPVPPGVLRKLKQAAGVPG
jgi:predicted metal-dependent phosphoesterase TrpH